MKVQLGGAGTRGISSGGTKSIEAHDHCLRGIALWQRRREAELFQAIQEFEAAIAADPTYAAEMALDPIRCDPRFRAVAKKLEIDDLRAATTCNKQAI